MIYETQRIRSRLGDYYIWSKSYEEFMRHLQIHVQVDQRIGHIYFDYNLETGGTGLDCAMLVTSAEWEWALDDHSSWSSHSSDPYGRAKIVDLMDAWKTIQSCLAHEVHS